MPKPFPCSPSTGERGCRGRDPPRFHKLHSASRQESCGRGQGKQGAEGDGQRRRRRGAEEGTCHLCVTTAFKSLCHQSAHKISTLFCKKKKKKKDSCTCFKDKETEAQRGEGTDPRSPSRRLAAELRFQSRSVSFQKLYSLHQTPWREEVISSGLSPPSVSWVIQGDGRKDP